MRWKGRRGSSNVEDRRGSPGRGVAMAGGGGLLMIGVVLIALCMGADMNQIMQLVQNVRHQRTTHPLVRQGLQERRYGFGRYV